MAIDIPSDPLKTVIDDLNDYVETRIDLVKFKTIDNSATVLSTLATGIVITLGIFLFLFLLCIGLSFYLGELLGKSYYGFFLVGGFFSLAIIILYLNRQKWLRGPFADMLVRNLLNH
jgi:hypothetical protein